MSASGPLQVTFQSRLTKQWITPFTDVRIEELAREGVKRVAVLASDLAEFQTMLYGSARILSVSPRDVIDGAWNLRVWPVTQALFLNYNLHLAHHRDPSVPWTGLPARVGPDDPRPGFWLIYLGLFRGARPAPPGPAPAPLTPNQWPKETPS